MTVVWY